MKPRRQAAPARPHPSLRQPPLTPVHLALDRLQGCLRPVPPERAPVTDAVGLVLAQSIVVSAAAPPRSVALRAGWAVAACDTVGASAYAPALPSEAPVWVETGDALPPGADAVLPPDGVASETGWPEITASVAPGEGVRRAGEDVAAGAVLRLAGERVRTLDAAVAASAGLDAVQVHRARLRLFGAGGAAAAFLSRAAREAGAAVERLPWCEAQGLAIAGADLLVAVGGPTGAAALAREGEVVAEALALRPGEGIACSLVHGVPAILVPDRLPDALAAMALLVRPCLDRLMAAGPAPPTFAGPLLRKLSSTVGLVEIALLRRAEGGLEPLATADLTLAAIAQADAWIAIPAEREGFPAGEVVHAVVL